MTLAVDSVSYALHVITILLCHLGIYWNNNGHAYVSEE